jgi:hypothetical protein
VSAVLVAREPPTAGLAATLPILDDVVIDSFAAERVASLWIL